MQPRDCHSGILSTYNVTKLSHTQPPQAQGVSIISPIIIIIMFIIMVIIIHAIFFLYHRVMVIASERTSVPILATRPTPDVLAAVLAADRSMSSYMQIPANGEVLKSPKRNLSGTRSNCEKLWYACQPVDGARDQCSETLHKLFSSTAENHV